MQIENGHLSLDFSDISLLLMKPPQTWPPEIAGTQFVSDSCAAINIAHNGYLPPLPVLIPDTLGNRTAALFVAEVDIEELQTIWAAHPDYQEDFPFNEAAVAIVDLLGYPMPGQAQ